MPNLRRLVMVALGLALVAGLLLACVSLVNYLRMDGGTFDEQAAEIVDRAERLRARAGRGYQQEVLGALPPNPLTREMLRLDELLPEATIGHADVKPVGEGRFLHSYEFEDANAPGLVARGKPLQAEIREGTLALQHAKGGYLAAASPLDLPMDAVGELVIRARVERGNYMRLSWSSREEIDPKWYGPGKPKFDLPVIADGSFHTYVVDAKSAFKASARRNERLQRLYMYPSDLPGDRVEIEFVRLVSKQRKYRAEPRGLSYEKIDEEMRRVLYMVPEQMLRYTLRVPEGEPRLDFGTALLSDGGPITFRVELEHEGDRAILHEDTIRDATQWHDARVDLAPWSGQDVTLTLEVKGPSENVAFWSSPRISSPPKEPFNIIVMLEDTQRADHLSVYGHERRTSPLKERLAEQEGVVFDTAISQATMTRPSVASMMTSLLPSATGVWKFTSMLNDSYLTLAEVLRQQGFVTASFIQNPQAGPGAGLHQGFDFLFDPDATTEEGSEYPRPEELFQNEELLRWIERHEDRNSFLYLHVIDPHGPYLPTEENRQWYHEAALETPAERDEALDAPWVERPTVEGRRALYDGEIRHNDGVLATFLRALGQQGLDEHTLFVFVSDHGEHLGEHGGLWEHHPPGYRQVTEVPLIFVQPGRFDGGRRVAPTVQLLDVMPTLLELAGVDTAPILTQGDSLVPLLEARGSEDGWRDRIVLSEESMSMDKSRPWRQQGLRAIGSVYFRNWHFISSRWLWPGRYVPESLRLETYALSQDPDEDDPLWLFAPDVWMRFRFARLMNGVQQNNSAARDRFAPEEDHDSRRMDPEELERLKALGYVE